MTVLINRIKELRDALIRTVNESRVSKATRREAIDFAELMKIRIRANTPDGSKWDDPPEVFSKRKIFPAQRSPRPSLRLHGVTLADSYGEPEISVDSRISATGGRITVQIPSIAPQAKWVIEGTKKKNYPIPNSIGIRKLFFYHNKENIVRWMDFIVHPGIQPNDYVQETFDNERSEAERRFRSLFRKLAFEPLEITFG